MTYQEVKTQKSISFVKERICNSLQNRMLTSEYSVSKKKLANIYLIVN